MRQRPGHAPTGGDGRAEAPRTAALGQREGSRPYARTATFRDREGTRWLVADLCDGSTLTRVTLGEVKVRDFVRHKTVLLKAGEQYVARPRRR